MTTNQRRAVLLALDLYNSRAPFDTYVILKEAKAELTQDNFQAMKKIAFALCNQRISTDLLLSRLNLVADQRAFANVSEHYPNYPIANTN